MPDFCTCGAELPPDALFCHKCGKPQRDIIAVEPEPQAVPAPQPQWAPVAPPPPDTPVSFRDRAAVRIALRVGVAATVLGLVLPLVNWLAAGFFSVFFYRRNTGRSLNVNAGVHIGWITGLVMFPMWTLAFAAQVLPAVFSGRFSAMMQEQMKQLQPHDPAVQRQVMQLLENGPALFITVMLMLAFFFLLSVALSVAGGAISAKMSNRD
jgi:hypothetical protein